MTEEQIAINRLLCGNTAHSCKADYIQTAIKALEEVQEYRAIGTVSELRAIKDSTQLVTEVLAEYTSIGTVEECRVARKLLPMKVTMNSNEYEYLQERMSRKLNRGLCTKKESAYNDGVLACKSILSEYHKMLTEKNK